MFFFSLYNETLLDNKTYVKRYFLEDNYIQYEINYSRISFRKIVRIMFINSFISYMIIIIRTNQIQNTREINIRKLIIIYYLLSLIENVVVEDIC